MILSKMLPSSTLALNSKFRIQRSCLFDLVPIARFQMIGAASMSVKCGDSKSGASFSSPITVKGRRVEVEVKDSERSRFEKSATKAESRDGLKIEEEDYRGLDGGRRCEVEDSPEVVVGGGVGSGGGGEIWFGDGYGDSGRENTSMEEYYEKMIQAYPGDALILTNYARFLKEVKGDAKKAEEYCERAILAQPNDENALSLYGDLIWKTHGDVDRAQSYFDQAVNSAPNDCYVLASYAKFLWDAGDEDDSEVGTNMKATNFYM